MKIKRQWLWNRLRAMSIQEIVHRCLRVARYGYDLVMYRCKWVSPGGINLHAADEALFDCRDAMSIGNETPLECLEHYRSLWLNNTIHLFDDRKQYSLGQTVQWLVDPETRITTPLRFGRSIDYRDDQSVGEIKYLWELGRHQFLVPMAIRIAANKDDLVKARLESHLSSWIEQNPIGMGIHWCSSLELSLRLISWSFIHSILQRGGMKNGIFDLNCDEQQLGVHILAQLKFVVSNYSRYSSSNNHLIGELTGVWMACNVFDLGAKGRRWRESAFAELHREIQLQTHEDGVNKEQAVYYHLWSLEYFWLAWSVAKRYKHTVLPAYEEHLVDMIVFLKSMCASTDAPSQIGDADGGVVSRFSPDICENVYQSFLESVVKVLASDAAQSCIGHGVYSKAYWYSRIVEQADLSSIVDLYNGKLEKIESVDVFNSGGYYKLRGQDCHLLYKAGPFGYLSTGAHGHADALSVTFALCGRWWLVDPGTYTYHSSGEWRNYFRGTAAHNTLCVNQSNQSDIAGDFLWSKKTDAHVQNVKSNRCESNKQLSASYIASVTGSHSGYSDLGVEHERTVRCDGAHTFEILDRVVLDHETSECDLQLSFHFHPEIYLKQLDTHRWLATRQDSSTSLALDLPEFFEWEVKRGCDSPIAGWYSETYGAKTPSNTLLGRNRLKKRDSSQSSLFRTVLLVQGSDACTVNDGVSR